MYTNSVVLFDLYKKHRLYIIYSIVLQLIHVKWIVSPPLSVISCNHDGGMLTNA